MTQCCALCLLVHKFPLKRCGLSFKPLNCDLQHCDVGQQPLNLHQNSMNVINCDVHVNPVSVQLIPPIMRNTFSQQTNKHNLVPIANQESKVKSLHC